MDPDLDPRTIAEELTTQLMERRTDLLAWLGRRGFAFEASDAVGKAHLTMLVQLNGLELTEQNVAEFRARWLDSGYAWRIAFNEALRLRERRTGSTPHPDGGRTYGPWISTDAGTSGDTGPAATYDDDAPSLASGPQHPDEVPAHLDRQLRQHVLRVVLMALVDRSARHRRGTFVSPEQFASYHAARVALAEESDRPLADAALALGIGADTVRQHVRRLQLAILATRYAVGVLGGPRWLRHAERIDAVLNTFDRLGTVAKARLQTASTCVLTDLDTGTRVRPEKYVGATRAVDAEASISELHDEESAFGRLVGGAQTNCVTRCATHNPTPDRVTEF